MYELLYTKFVILHVLSVMVAVGTVTVADYLHIIGLRNSRFEKKSLFVLPHLSHLIRISLLLIYITGIALVFMNPSLLSNSLFLVKVFLVVIVTINGYVLHHNIFPQIKDMIQKGKNDSNLLKKAAFGGSLSVVTWYAIVILAMSRDLGYSWISFFIGYLVFLLAAYLIALQIEFHSRQEHTKQKKKKSKK